MTISRITVSATRPYQVLVGNGLINQLAPLLEESIGAHRYAIITDSLVARSHALRVCEQITPSARCSLFAFPAGESAKTRATWHDLTDQMLAAGMGRDCAVVGVGGGVVGDIAGFVAATFMRGVPLINVPTTLLAMVDSSIGGKTGVDTPHGKNLVGAFYQPELVIADLDTLRTLPRDEFANGMAEALKHGAVGDADYFEFLAAAPEPGTVKHIVERSVQIKGAIVAQDEFEGGKRAVLNFGHTVGHAIERATDFGIKHGAAVSIGMVTEAAVGTALGVTAPGTAERIGAAAVRLGLPDRLPAEISMERLVVSMGFDKKNQAGNIHCSLLEQIGVAARTTDGDWTHEVSRAALQQALNL